MPDGDAAVPAGMLQTSVTAGQPGPVIMLSGEADITCAAQLNTLITAQLSGGTRQLTIDASGLRFADSAATRVLLLAARTVKERGGNLVLLRPQRPVARTLALLGAEHMFTIRGGETKDEPEPESKAV